MPKRNVRRSIEIVGLICACLVLATTLFAITAKQERPASELLVEEKANSTYKVVAVGDIACDPTDKNASAPNRCKQAQTAEITKSINPEKILLLGDIQYEGGTYDAFLKSFDVSWGALKDKMVPAVGNHEYGTKNAGGYFDYFDGIGAQAGVAGDRDKGYYSTDLADWHVIVLNANCEYIGGCGAGSTQYNWLRDDIAKHQGQCLLATWHQPRFSSSQHGQDPKDTERSVDFWRLLYSAEADVILNAHDHIYERFDPQNPAGEKDEILGIRQFTVGTGGKELYPVVKKKPNSVYTNTTDFGVLLLNLSEASYTWQFTTIDSKTLDSGTAYCHTKKKILTQPESNIQ